MGWDSLAGWVWTHRRVGMTTIWNKLPSRNTQNHIVMDWVNSVSSMNGTRLAWLERRLFMDMTIPVWNALPGSMGKSRKSTLQHISHQYSGVMQGPREEQNTSLYYDMVMSHQHTVGRPVRWNSELQLHWMTGITLTLALNKLQSGGTILEWDGFTDIGKRWLALVVPWQ